MKIYKTPQNHLDSFWAHVKYDDVFFRFVNGHKIIPPESLDDAFPGFYVVKIRKKEDAFLICEDSPIFRIESKLFYRLHKDHRSWIAFMTWDEYLKNDKNL